MAADKVSETSHNKETGRATHRLCAFPRAGKTHANKREAYAKSHSRRQECQKRLPRKTPLGRAGFYKLANA
jgi:hypothetical protein